MLIMNHKYIHNCTRKIKSLRNIHVNSLPLCKWSIGMGITNNCDYSICSLVIRYNNLPVLKEIVKDYPDWKPDRLDVLLSFVLGDLDQLEWLACTFGSVKAFLDDYFDYNWLLMRCGYGFQYLYGIRYSENNLCDITSAFGRLHMLKWLRSQDPPCPYNRSSCSNAAKFGHLHVLQWLRSQSPPCPWNERTCSDAAENGHLNIYYYFTKR